MIEELKKFETLVLKPLWLVIFILAIFSLLKGLWLSLIYAALALFYLGIIGSKLHPFQSVSDLAEGPVSNSVAGIERELFPLQYKKLLIGHACTRVGILVGVSIGFFLWLVLGWHWYWAALIAYVTTIFSGALLKVAFKTLR